MEESIFTKIVKGEIPAHKIYEDEDTLAFLDIFPATEGHTLVIPKKQVEFIWDLSTEDYAKLMATVQKIGQRLREKNSMKYVGTVVVGTDVPHAHVHVLPFEQAHDMKAALAAERSNGEPDHENLAKLAETLRF